MRLLRIELKKATHNKFFIISVILGITIGAFSAAYVSGGFVGRDIGEIVGYAPDAPIEVIRNPLTAIYTLFSNVLSTEYSSVAPSVFYFLLPFIAMLGYGWSYNSELRSGYIKNIVVRTGKVNYFASKYIATFISGGLVCLIPLLSNLLLAAAFCPAVTPNPYYNIYYGMPIFELWSKYFYSQPYIYLLLMFTLSFIISGIFACTQLAFSMFIKNKFAVIILPFIIFVAYDYFCQTFLNTVTETEMSPQKMISAGLSCDYPVPVAVTVLVIFAISLSVTMIKGKKSDVF